MATITSNQSGNWNVTSTWVGGSIPAADDLVVIAHGHKVTVNTNIQSTRTGNVTIDGNLHFANGGKMHLHGRMTVNNTSYNSNNTGEFVEGTAASGSLLSMVGGSEIKISGNNADQHGIQVNTRKWCGVDLQGSEPTLYTNLNGNHNTKSTYLTVNDSSNFVSGDLISLYELEVDYRISPNECFYIHDVDNTNNRIYVRQFVTPEAVISSKSGSTITVDDARVFRVGYNIVFGTGSNRNAKKITAINGNVISFSTSVTGSVDGEKAYVSGTEKYHPDDRIVRRLATSVKTAITSTGTTNQVTIGDASDLNVGDEILLEAGTDDGTYNYTSGSESNVWRHNLLYTISSKSGNTLTLNRNIDYKSDVGVLVVRMTRDIVIKACKTDGTEVPDGDQDSARVFFNVKYWTSTTWYNAPTRRVKVKYVRFKGLGYNTNDSTNFRAGVTIAGYNGRYHTDVNGSGADQTTVHTSSGVSQTGENYVHGCSITAYNLTSNSTQDGDSYVGLCIRHPYGHTTTDNVMLGTGRGLWRWSTGYYIKDSGNISMVSSYINMQYEALYATHSSIEYAICRMAEDYGFYQNNGREDSVKTIRHIDIRTQQSYAFDIGYLNMGMCLREKWHADKYRYIYKNSNTDKVTFVNSKFMPNLWDGSSAFYNGVAGKIYSEEVRHNGNGNYDAWRNAGATGFAEFYEHGFKSDEYVQMHHRVTRLKKDNNSYWDVLVGNDTRKSMFDNVFVPANTVVRIKSTIYVNPKTYLGGNASISTDGYPYLIAKPANGFDMYKNGRYADQIYDNQGGVGWDDDYFANNYFLDSTNGDLYNGFVEYATHTNSAIGNWEEKIITIQAQDKGYMLTYGLWWDNNSMKTEGMKMKDIDIAFASPSVSIAQSNGLGLGKKSVRTSFNTGKKRIGGTRL